MDDPFTALYGQPSSIKKTMDEIARTRENISEKGKNGFQFTKQEIKAMPEHIRKIFIANNYIVNYRITSNGYFEARVRRKGMYIEASGRDFETMRSRFLQRLTAFYERPPVPTDRGAACTRCDGQDGAFRRLCARLAENQRADDKAFYL